MKRVFCGMVVLFVLIALVSCGGGGGVEKIIAPPIEERTAGNDSLPTLALIGDSRIAFMPREFFTDRYQVFNYGVGGSSSMQNAVLVASIPPNVRFDKMIISAGFNDRKFGMNAQDSANCIAIALTYAKLHADEVYVTTIPGATLSRAMVDSSIFWLAYYSWTANQFIPNVARNAGATLISLAHVMNAGASMYAPERYFEADGIHYSREGYEVLRDLFEQHLAGDQ